MHRTLALALEGLVTPQDAPEVAREVARHADRGGEPALAYRFALIASEGATERYAFGEALSWLDLGRYQRTRGAETDSGEPAHCRRTRGRRLERGSSAG